MNLFLLKFKKFKWIGFEISYDYLLLHFNQDLKI